MFYIMYLTGLCNRRHWPDPLYECNRTRHGYTCTVRVNNREYTTDCSYESIDLARNAAATQAYMICRNFSVTDGMYPGERRDQGGVIQGLPVAIGTGRRATCSSVSPDYDSGSTGSGGSSPRSSDCGLDAEPRPTESRRSSKSSNSALFCYCGRGAIRAYDRCSFCLRESGRNYS